MEERDLARLMMLAKLLKLIDELDDLMDYFEVRDEESYDALLRMRKGMFEKIESLG